MKKEEEERRRRRGVKFVNGLVVNEVNVLH